MTSNPSSCLKRVVISAVIEVFCLAIAVLYKDGICLSSDTFDIERRNTQRQAEWFECTL